MNHISIDSVTQASIHVQSQIDEFFNRFRIATIFHRCGLRKRHGYSVRSLTQAIFTLPFIGKNFFRGIVVNPDVPFGKDAAYQLLKGSTYNWRKVLLRLAVLLHSFFNRLTDDEREAVLIIDDSTYDRSRSKMVELLSRVHDHATGRFLKGFRMLTICWSDGVSCLPLDFALLSSADAKKRLCENPQHLRLAKEIQCRDFDALIAHTSSVFMRYMFIVYQCRCQSDHRTFGDLFYRCCSEVDDISFIEALYRVLSLAVDQIRKIGSFCEKTASAFFDAIIDTALQCVGLSKNNLIMKPES
jgi:hypothetical protein